MYGKTTIIWNNNNMYMYICIIMYICNRVCKNRPSERKYRIRFFCIKLTIMHMILKLGSEFTAVQSYSAKVSFFSYSMRLIVHNY